MVSVERTDWTVAQLQAIPDDGNRYEIIDGVLYVTPSPLMPHQLMVTRLLLQLGPYANARGLDMLASPADIEFADDTLVQPDLLAFPKVNGKSVAHYNDIEHLTLVVEVLSKSTARRDRTVKRRLYQAQRIPEYWIVDIAAHCVERWRPDATECETLTGSIDWQPDPQAAPLRIDLKRLFGDMLGE